ncbi:MAG TPA: family 43 glycosylhydrolase, partial [Puia sp.]|nr:family 43 glycosylhydrolase [Puia sp.]
TRKFIMWMHMDKSDYSFAHAGVAVSDRPEGPYKYLGSVRPNGQESRDMTVFKDDNDKAYLVYASENNNTMHICPLSEDYLSPTSNFNRILIDQRREAPALFKHNGKYFLITSLCSGWSPNAALYSVADSMMGKWENRGNPCTGPGSDTTFAAQSSFVLSLQETPGSFIFMADRWNKTNLAHSGYLWIPFRVEQDVLKIQNNNEIADHFWDKSGRVRSVNAMADQWRPEAWVGAASILQQRVHVDPYAVLQFAIKIKGEEGSSKGKSFIQFYDSADRKLLEYKNNFTSAQAFQQTGNYTEAPPYTHYAMIGIETDSSNSGTLYVDSFHLELNIGEPAVRRTTTCNLDQYMRPFWNSDTVFNETVLMLSDSGKAAGGRLLYTPDHIISVRRFDMAEEYKKGQDYNIQGRSIQRTSHSGITSVDGNFFDKKNDLAWFNLQSRWILVTYTHHDPWTGPRPVFKGDRLPLLMKKLKSKSSLTIIGYGMSITRGMNISSYDDVPPYMPSYLELFARQLRKKYEYTDITMVNAALPGALVSWGADNADAYLNPLHPDLVIIDFGMNDFWRYTPEEFKKYIQTIISKVKEKNPGTEFILISTMDFDPAYILDTDKNKSFYVSNIQGYKKVLREMETSGIINLDMTSLSDAIYSRKKAKDCITNPLHPNDYLARWYAQCITALVCRSY